MTDVTVATSNDPHFVQNLLRRSGFRFAKVLSFSAATVLLGACGEGDCVGVNRYGVRIQVLDAGTQQPIGQTPTVTIIDGSHTEVLTLDPARPDQRIYVGSYERVGTYDVRIEAPGFSSVTRNDVRVSRDRQCDLLQPKEVTVALSANPS